MPELEPDPFYIDQNVIVRIAERLKDSELAVDQKLVGYLSRYGTEQITASNSLFFLGMAAREAHLVREVAMDSAVIERRNLGFTLTGPLKWGADFIRQILVELRRIICGPKGKIPDLSHTSQAVISALAAAIVAKFNVSSASASGFAVLVLLTLSRAIKRAFCKMTDEEVLADLRNSA